jgi:hypothetical protein
MIEAVFVFSFRAGATFGAGSNFQNTLFCVLARAPSEEVASRSVGKLTFDLIQKLIYAHPAYMQKQIEMSATEAPSSGRAIIYL